MPVSISIEDLMDDLDELLLADDLCGPPLHRDYELEEREHVWRVRACVTGFLMPLLYAIAFPLNVAEWAWNRAVRRVYGLGPSLYDPYVHDGCPDYAICSKI